MSIPDVAVNSLETGLLTLKCALWGTQRSDHPWNKSASCSHGAACQEQAAHVLEACGLNSDGSQFYPAQLSADPAR